MTKLTTWDVGPRDTPAELVVSWPVATVVSDAVAAAVVLIVYCLLVLVPAHFDQLPVLVAADGSVAAPNTPSVVIVARSPRLASNPVRP